MARKPCRVGGLVDPAEALGTVGRKARGALVGGGRGGVAASLEGSRCRALECGSDLLVGTEGCRGQVPGSLLRVSLCERLGERGVRGAPLGRSCGVVDR